MHVTHCAKRLAEVNVVQRVDHARHQRNVALDVGTALHRLHVDEVDAGGARPEVSPPWADIDVPGLVAVAGKQGEAARCFAQRVFDNVRWQPDAFTVYPGACFFQNLTCFLVVNFQASVLQHMQHAVEQLLKLIVGEHLEAHARVHSVVTSHRESSMYEYPLRDRQIVQLIPANFLAISAAAEALDA